MDVAWRQRLGSWWRKEGEEEEGEMSGSLWESWLLLLGSLHTSDGPWRDTFHGSPLFSCKSLGFRVPRDWLIVHTVLAFFHESNSSTTWEALWVHVHETESTFATSGRGGEWREKDTRGEGRKWRKKAKRVSKFGKESWRNRSFSGESPVNETREQDTFRLTCASAVSVAKKSAASAMIRSESLNTAGN